MTLLQVDLKLTSVCVLLDQSSQFLNPPAVCTLIYLPLFVCARFSLGLLESVSLLFRLESGDHNYAG